MDNKYCNEMSVYGIIPKGGPTDDDLSDEDFLVTVDTKITYISRYYRHVFVLDLSPSTIVADEESDCCLCTRLMKSLRTSMVSAVKGFLIQGVLLTESNVHKIISTVTEKFKVLFTRLYEFAHPILNRWGRLKRRYKNYKFDSVCETSIGDTDSLIEDYDFRQLNPVKNPGPEEKPPRPPNIMSYPRGTWNLYDEGQEGFPAGAVVEGYILPEWSLIFMLRIGLISTQMLPENTQSNVILITDAVCGIPDAAALQKVLTQLRSYTIACSFIQLQSHSSSEPVFGHVASCELFHFLAMATFGTYLPNCKCVSGEDYVVEEEDYEKDNDSGEDSDEYVEEPLAVRLKTVQKLEASQYEEEAYVSLNSYHRALICWCFQNALADNEHITKTIMAINPEFAQLHKQGVERHCRLATVYRSNLHQLLYVRLREGFTLKSAHVSEDGNLIHVVLCLPFRPLVFLEYSIWSPWPAERCERHDVKVELVIQAPYNELKDLLTEGQYLDPARLNLTKSVVDSIIEADRLLLHIHSFNTAVPFYTIPRGVTTEYALFSVHERTVIRQPNTCLGPHEEAKTRCFIDFWRVLLELNDSTWQKWVHTHSERVVLAVDGLPFEAFNTTRTLQLPCFRAFTVLLECIKKHSSFCLVNRSTFVTFCGTRKDGSPEYFYMTRICLEPPCVVLKTAFLGGINTSVRRRVVDEFRVRLLGLKFEVEKKDQADEDDDDSDDSDVPSESEGARGGLPVLNVIRRPMERIMVRYREVPADLRMIVRVQEETVDEDEIKLITLHNAIAKCLVCRRTVIVLTDYGVTGGAFEARPVADFILNVLVKRRLREHFKPAWTQNNIFSLCRQVFSQSSYVLEQFIMFPATTVSIPLMRRRGNAQRGRKQCTIYPMPSRESSRALALVTELWTEPDAVDATGQQVLQFFI
ncbi:unnamed protein product [Caenorhabditis auriculariae]|uniref:Protein SZT2 n=1 Tax=Caenorhabditis auriculariae TaxID=2777116 RepID=A0A8S1H4K6_9PELO|nr:unnamed protein product [Caenorhabditis auriculariae]